MRIMLAAITALALTAAPAMAQSWETGDEGDAVALIATASGDATFSVECPQVQYAAPAYHFRTTAFRNSREQFLPVVFDIDGQRFETSFTNIVPEQNEYIMDGDSIAYGSQIQVINDAMARGRVLTVSIPSLRISTRFSLSGSGRAIAYVMDNCG